MGKSKKSKKEKKLQARSPVKQEDVTPSSSHCEKDQKKGNKKFGLALLRQAGESGWEGHELLADITQKSQFSREHVVQLLRVSCSHAETLKACGRLLHSFCMGLTEGQAVFYITTVMKFDFVLDLYGLLEEFLDELGDLRPAVEQPIRDILKVNRLGEVVDSDADEEGNLKDFVVDDEDDSPRKTKRSSVGPSSSNGKRTSKGKGKVFGGRAGDGNDDEDEDVEGEEEEYDDEEAMEGLPSDESDSEGAGSEGEGESDEGGVFMNQRTWSASSDSEAIDDDGDDDNDDDGSVHKPNQVGGLFRKRKSGLMGSGKGGRSEELGARSSSSSSSEEEDCMITQAKSKSSLSAQNAKRKRVIQEDDSGSD